LNDVLNGESNYHKNGKIEKKLYKHGVECNIKEDKEKQCIIF
jgi:hypothetical protein